MATPSDVEAALRMIRGNYSNYLIDDDVTRAWIEQMRDVPGEALIEATRLILVGRTSEWGPHPGQVRSMALGLVRQARERERHREQDRPASTAQAQHIQALKANVAAAFSLDSKTRAAGKSGAVYRRIADGARRAGTADLPDWTPPGAEAPQERAHGPASPTHTDTPGPASNRVSEPRWGLYDDPETEWEA